MITYKNTVTGHVVHFSAPVIPMDNSSRWERVDEPEPEVQGSAFDPREHTAAEVNAYLADADADERARVVAAERQGRNRRSVVGDDRSPSEPNA